MFNTLKPGDVVGPLQVENLLGESVLVPDQSSRLVHLQFRRFAGCPICNLHLRQVAKRIDEVRSAGIREVAFFHSTREDMLPFQGDLPFDVIADPQKVFYARFGVEASLRAILDPRAWWGFLRGVAAPHPSSSTRGDDGGHLGLPADFLVDRSGVVVACKYGTHADDQWSVDELLAIAQWTASGSPRELPAKAVCVRLRGDARESRPARRSPRPA